MDVFIIYAALSIVNFTTFVDFKGEQFKTMEECKKYFNDNYKIIEHSLHEHIQDTLPEYTISYVGCSPKRIFIEKST